MRLIDADRLPVHKVGNVPVVLWENVENAKTHFTKVKEVAPADTIDVRWLQKRMIDGIGQNIYSDEHLDSKYFAIINGYIEEYKREVQNADE